MPLRTLSLCLLLGLMPCALAQSRIDSVMPETLVDHRSAFYDFNARDFDAVDGARHYRVWIATPKAKAPTKGFAVLYLLDGNAALSALDDSHLQALQDDPPVLVFLGYANGQRFDLAGRAYDYTPAVNGDIDMRDALADGRRNGGAGAFLDLLERQVMPWVASQVPLDSERRTLWGHSYGGLLTLHTLFTRPQLFTRYVAVDASLWWHDGYLLEEAAAFDSVPGERRLALLVGDADVSRRSAPPGADPARVAARRAAVNAVPKDAARQLGERLAQVPGLRVDYQRFAGADHGRMLALSLPEALRMAQAR